MICTTVLPAPPVAVREHHVTGGGGDGFVAAQRDE